MKDELRLKEHCIKVSHHGFADIYFNSFTGQKSFIATTSFHKHALITAFSAGTVHAHPTCYTIQVNDSQHIELMPFYLQFINHSCEPNAFFDTNAMNLVCIEHINPGDEITFFYPSSEWMMTAPFTCQCGSSKCMGKINGAAYLSANYERSYRFTGFIQRKQYLKKL